MQEIVIKAEQDSVGDSLPGYEVRRIKDGLFGFELSYYIGSIAKTSRLKETRREMVFQLRKKMREEALRRIDEDVREFLQRVEG
jgi:hypothetical protein